MTCPRMPTFTGIFLISQRLPTCTLGPLVPFRRNSKKCNDPKRGCKWWRDRYYENVNVHFTLLMETAKEPCWRYTHLLECLQHVCAKSSEWKGGVGTPAPVVVHFQGTQLHTWCLVIYNGTVLKGVPSPFPLVFLTIWLLSLLSKMVEAGWVGDSNSQMTGVLELGL